jgi:hypothetical protein
VRVAVGREHLDHALAHLQDRDVEGAAAEVVDGDQLGLVATEAIRQSRGRRLVDDPQELETRDATGVARRLPLGVVEDAGGDDRLLNRVAEVLLRDALSRARCEDLRDRDAPATRTRTSLFGPSASSYGSSCRKLATSGESYERPISRFAAYTVFFALVTACRFAR